jgi:hypothetical protein
MLLRFRLSVAPRFLWVGIEPRLATSGYGPECGDIQSPGKSSAVPLSASFRSHSWYAP